MDKKFQKSDFIDGIFFQEVHGFVEMYRIGVEVCHDGCGEYFLNHGLIRFSDINLLELLEAFDAGDIAGLKEKFGQDWERDAILAWFDMECQSGSGAGRVNLTAFGTYKEAFQMMCLLSGYQEEGKKTEDEELEISRTLVISTAHISPQTARLMDDDDIHAGFYSAGESGYNILTVDWEDYSGMMPDDLKACVKFAAEHGCDWLCLDGDARTVPGLPVYEWDKIK